MAECKSKLAGTAIIAALTLSGCANNLVAIPGFVYETPQIPFTPISSALQCAGSMLSKAFSDPSYKKVTILYLDGFYDGTVPNARYTNGPLIDYSEREFARALIRTVPYSNFRIMYVFPENANVANKYGVGNNDIALVQRDSILLKTQMAGFGKDAQIFIVRGVYTQAETSPVSQWGAGVSNEIKTTTGNIAPSISSSSTASTVALTVDIANPLQQFIADSNTFIMNSGGTRTDGRLAVTVNDVSFGFTFQDETTATLQSAQRTLVEAAAFWTLTTLFNDNIDLTPCVGLPGATPENIVRAAIQWNSMNSIEKRMAMRTALRKSGYIDDDAHENESGYTAAIAKAQKDMYGDKFFGAKAYFPFSDSSLGLLYLRLTSNMIKASQF